MSSKKRKYRQRPVIKITGDNLNVLGLLVDAAILISIWFTFALSKS